MQDERWLVKSSGRILGPFSLDELVQHLRARTLSIIDEIREPSSRWGFIREHTQLREVVHQLREEDDHHPEATQTTFVNTQGRTVTLSVTESLAQEGEFTPNPFGGGRRSSDARPIQANERNVAGGLGSSSYGSLNDQRVQKKLAQRRMIVRVLMWGLVVVAFVIGAGLVGYRQKQHMAAVEQGKQWLQVAHEQVRFGQMAKAAEFARKAAPVIAFSDEDRIMYAELLLQAEGKSADALRLLSETQNIQDTRLVREMGLAKTLVFMKEQRWNEATVELNSLLSFNPNDEEALHNQTMLEFFRNNVALSMQSLENLIEKGYQNAQLPILRGELALRWPDKSGQAQRVNQAAEDLQRNLQEDDELRFEKTLVLIGLRLQAGKNDDAVKALNELWNADPLDSRNFLQPLNIDQQILGWDRLSPFCESASAALNREETGSALMAVCLYQRGETAAALQKMDEARRQFSRSPVLAALHADLLFNVGRVGEAKTFLQLAGDTVLGQLVQGQICQSERDWGCAETAWRTVLKARPKNPMALFGEAFVIKQRGNDISSREEIRKAILSSPRYRPFLEARGDGNVF